jgi:hypothetical protein
MRALPVQPEPLWRTDFRQRIAPQVVRRLHGLLDELESTLPAERQAAITGQRSLLEAAVSAALPAPFASVASTADRGGLG